MPEVHEPHEEPPAVTAGWRADAAAALPGWVAARLVVAAAWGANALLVAWRLDGVEPVPTTQGLLAWDAAYYEGLAEHGYAAASEDAARFHPLLSLLGVNGLGVLVVANVAAYLAAAMVHRLVVEVRGDADLARRATTLVGLAPPAFAMVFGYAESLLVLLAAGYLLLLHRRAWWAAGPVGFAATLARPNGLLLAGAGLVEAVVHLRSTGLRRRSRRQWAAMAAAVAGPVLGMVSFLLWIGRVRGDWYLPIRVQNDLRGGFVLPPLRLVEGVGEMVGDPFGDGLHVPFALLSLVLVWVCWTRRFPLAWTTLAAVSVLTNLAADNLNSTERYAYGTVPLLVALASIAGGRWWRPVLAACVLGLLGMTTLAWYGRYVP